MKKTFAAFALVLAAIASPLSYASDPSAVSHLVKTWAKAQNKPVVWEAGNDYDGRMVQMAAVDVSQPEGVGQALAGLNRLLEKVGMCPEKCASSVTLGWFAASLNQTAANRSKVSENYALLRPLQT